MYEMGYDDMLCPHCNGKLIETNEPYVQWKYECQQCGRVWFVLDDVYWLAGYDAAGHVYKIEDGKIEEVRDKVLWEQLWNRVREMLRK